MSDKRQHFSRFRTTVLKAASTLAGSNDGRRVFTREMEEPSAEAHKDFEPSLSPEESQTLSNLVHLSALKVLQTVGTISAFKHQSGLSPAQPDKNMQLSTADLPRLCIELYERFQAFCPKELLPALPGPQVSDQSQLGEVWNQLGDSRISAHWDQESTLGFVYQFFSTPLRREAQDILQSANKTLTLRRLISFTQLYTPDWVIDFLLQNTLMTQWTGTGKQNGHDFFIGQFGECRRYKVDQLKLIDPACGSGHFLLRAFDLLMEMYRQEGCSEQEAVISILQNNLAGVDIDPVALWISALCLMLKSLRYVPTPEGVRINLAHVQDNSSPNPAQALLGSLSPHWSKLTNHPLSHKYNAVVTNPPYIGRKLLDRRLKNTLKELYPDCHQDLCAAFIRRGLELLSSGGRLGLIGQSSLLFLPTYGDLRKHLIDSTKLVAVVEAGPGVFPLQGGEKVNSALVIIESGIDSARLNAKAKAEGPSLFFDIVSQSDKEHRLKEIIGACRKDMEIGSPDLYLKNQDTFKRQRRYAFNYKCPALVMTVIESCKKLGEIADLRQGLATSDNERFVRYRCEVDPDELGVRWFPYVKGAGCERWWAPVDHVVDWKDNGAAIKRAVAEAYPYLNGKTAWVVKNEQFYFQSGLTFSFVNSRGLAVRQLPPGCIFDVGGSAIFADPIELDFLLGYLNSTFVLSVARLLNPTINFQVGDLKQLPVLPISDTVKREIGDIARRCCEIKQLLHESLRTSSNDAAFGLSIDTADGASLQCRPLSHPTDRSTAEKELEDFEARIDELVTKTLLDRYGTDPGEIAELLGWMEVQSRGVRRPTGRGHVSGILNAGTR